MLLVFGNNLLEILVLLHIENPPCFNYLVVIMGMGIVIILGIEMRLGYKHIVCVLMGWHNCFLLKRGILLLLKLVIIIIISSSSG